MSGGRQGVELETLLTQLEHSVETCDEGKTRQLFYSVLELGAPGERLRSLLLQSFERLRRRLLKGVSVPDLLIASDLVIELMGRLRVAGEVGKIVVIGVVRGDPHDIGKNIIARVYETAGYSVVDLGKDVPDGKFVEAVVNHKAHVLGLSAMMSTTMVAMPEIIKEVKRKSPQTRVIVGGACLSRAIAARFGADGYADSAATVLEETESLFE